VAHACPLVVNFETMHSTPNVDTASKYAEPERKEKE
jgi:hypothetical protein